MIPRLSDEYAPDDDPADQQNWQLQTMLVPYHGPSEKLTRSFLFAREHEWQPLDEEWDELRG